MAPATKPAELANPVHSSELALAGIGRKYHSKMGMFDASSDSLSDGVVVPALREAIVEGVLAPGNRLSETQIAKQLNVSRTPMREAFAQLERDGLVTVVSRVGAFVRSVTARDVAEIYTVRTALECLAVQLCAENITTLGRAQLEDVIGEMRASMTADDPVAYTDALDRFYSIVMTHADNRTLQATHASLMGAVRRLSRIAMERGGRMRSSFEQTVEIKDAIATGDTRVQDLMREQLRVACEAATEALKETESD